MSKELEQILYEITQKRRNLQRTMGIQEAENKARLAELMDYEHRLQKAVEKEGAGK